MSRSQPVQPTASRAGLSSRSFLGLLGTQFLGALNDNMFRWFVVPIAKPLIGTAEALSLGLACFTLPYLLLTAMAGFLADRYSKRTVIVGCKLAEIAIMVLGIVTIHYGSVSMLFVVVAMMGCQSALFGPSKFGSIPEMVRTEQLSQGNGWMGLITVVASAIGFVTGNWLFVLTKPDLSTPGSMTELLPVASVLVGVAVFGWLTSLTIRRLPAADPGRHLPPNPFSETARSLRLLTGNKPLLRTALGIAFFWMLASLAQMNIDMFVDEELNRPQQDVGPLLGILVIGLGVGSVLAGLWSGGKVELGIVPLGALGIAVSSLMLYLTGSSVDPASAGSFDQAYYSTCLWLLLLGLGAGLFNIPLEAYLQDRSDPRVRGTILAASNFVAFSFILATSGLFLFMEKVLHLSASQIFLVAGLGTIPVALYILSLLPDATIRFVVWLASHMVYRVRVNGRENIPNSGGALLVANHVSWIDGILLLITSSRPIRMIAYADYVSKGPVAWLARTFGVIPISAGQGPKSILRSLQSARKAIINGELVCVFAEGSITRTGQLQPFQRGMMRIVERTDISIVPVYLDGLWGSIFSFRGGRFLWKRPNRWPYPVLISFGKPFRKPENVDQVRQAVERLGVETVKQRKAREMVPPRLFVRKCRQDLFRNKVADSTGTELTGGKLLTGTLAFKRLLKSRVLAPDEKMVGILLPPSVGGVIANAAVSMLPKVAVNLNYTLSNEDVNFCIKQCGIKHVLTSRRFLEQRPFELDAELVYLEDLKQQIGSVTKGMALAQTFLLPAFVLERLHGLTRITPDDLLTVIFTSGSTGEPKGVMLSQHNVQSNTEGVDEMFHFSREDVLLGVLPFFHSFGFTVTLWLVLTLDPKGVYHFNPLDGRQVGKLCGRHGVTILLSTPTFLRSYLKRCTPEQMKALDLIIVGAEKLPLELANTCEETFGVVPTEGYGTTELSPVASANVPDHRSGDSTQIGTKLGTVGRPFPGVAAKVTDPDTHAELGTNQDGLLWIKGPNVMQGYLNLPEKTADVIRDGWYNTGDIAKIDDEGFITITGRQTRFSKIGGEMVPHIKVEELLAEIVTDPDAPEPEEGIPDINVAVTAVPDEKKGERLIVVHRPLSKSVDQVLKELAETGLPNLWLPSPESFLEMEQIPLLGTGKLDLKQLKELAIEHFVEPAGKA
jgi:acyl-[acyl-carrier-protein]-phospholipid O-acyltransferase/long-chain-fatty-acid--[acyl-carrier-protein] ligase